MCSTLLQFHCKVLVLIPVPGIKNFLTSQHACLGISIVTKSLFFLHRIHESIVPKETLFLWSLPKEVYILMLCSMCENWWYLKSPANLGMHSCSYDTSAFLDASQLHVQRNILQILVSNCITLIGRLEPNMFESQTIRFWWVVIFHYMMAAR